MIVRQKGLIIGKLSADYFGARIMPSLQDGGAGGGGVPRVSPVAPSKMRTWTSAVQRVWRPALLSCLVVSRRIMDDYSHPVPPGRAARFLRKFR